MPPLNPESHDWFTQNLQPHEGMLRAWLRSRFGNDSEVDDIVQEAFVRVLKAGEITQIDSPKAFLFATARNIALGNVRKKAYRGEKNLADLYEPDILDESENVTREVSRSEELELLTQAIQSLPTRCRQIITLRKIYGMPQKDIAEELGISVNTVETQGTIGMRKLGEFFQRIERQDSMGL